jgi:voltage-gated potassium channel
MIIINVILFILSTEPSIRDGPIENFFDGIEYFFVAVFSIELGLRFWTCTEQRFYKRLGPIVGRLRFSINPYTIIDMLAILPFYIQIFLPSSDRLTFITAIRMFRIFRLFKVIQK